MQFRLEVERLKRVEADLAAARGAAATARKRRRSCAVRPCMVWHPVARVGDRLDRMCAPGRSGLLISLTCNEYNFIPTIFLLLSSGEIGRDMGSEVQWNVMQRFAFCS
jgi:hypothetical protein